MTSSSLAESAPFRRTAPRSAGILLWMLDRAGAEWTGPALILQTPEGIERRYGAAGGEPAWLIVRDWRFVRRALAAGDIGLAEGYVAGEWDTPDLARLLAALADNFERLDRFANGGRIARAVNWIFHRLGRLNTREGARRNIIAHYDLGNAFYERWLDASMTYSSALWTRPDQTLQEAQREKYAALAASIDLKPQHRVLEIGCGWGGFAEYAAREIGCQVTGVTISPAQHAYATERMRRAGVADLVDLRLIDYRDVQGKFDRVVSIEMFEAVGEKWWPTFFQVVRARLKPMGRAGLQIITIRDDLFADYRRRVDFIQKYVFPGGLLPSEERLKQEVQAAGLTWDEPLRFGLDYARTLASWAQAFKRTPPRADAAFDRQWLFYLAYCEAGFATGRTNVIQVGLRV